MINITFYIFDLYTLLFSWKQCNYTYIIYTCVSKICKHNLSYVFKPIVLVVVLIQCLSDRVQIYYCHIILECAVEPNQTQSPVGLNGYKFYLYYLINYYNMWKLYCVLCCSQKCDTFFLWCRFLGSWHINLSEPLNTWQLTKDNFTLCHVEK